ncbi:MAG: hypothetical protein R3E31_00005 [Chloroflexota bacterium]
MSSRNLLQRNSVIFLSLIFALAMLLALQFQFTHATPHAAGDLDPAFGTNGVTLTNINGNDVPYGIALRSDGKFFVIAEADFTSSSQSVMLLYNTDGTLDASFGSSGVNVLTPFNVGFNGQATAVALQSDGKPVVAGFLSTGGNKNFAVTRYQSDGSLDTGFGVNGLITTPVSLTFDDEPTSLAIQSDGKIVAAGQTQNIDFALVRYEADGTLDTTFGVGGVVTTNFPIGMSGGVDVANDVIIQSDGKIVAAGRSAGRFGVARYNTNGSLDTSFGVGGVVSTVVGMDPFMAAYAVVQQPDGKLLVGGTGYNDVDSHYAYALVRYNTDGSLDTNFGTDGITKIDFGGGSTSYDLVLRPDGKIVMVGDGSNGTNGLGVSLVQFNEDGSVDTTFGAGELCIPAAGTRATDAVLQPNGKLIVMGYFTSFSTPEDIFLARYDYQDLSYEIYLPFVVKP